MIRTATVTQKAPLEGARWIWFAEGNPAASAPVSTRYFRAQFAVDGKRKVQAAQAFMTADNEFTLFINGHEIGGGDNFHRAEVFDVARSLKPGTNEIRVTAKNTEAPGPAGLVGALHLTYTDGTQQKLNTDSSWEASLSAQGTWSAALELGALNVAPWNFNDKAVPIYQPYAETARLLQDSGIAPDVKTETGAPIRAIHRKISDGDLYFIANPQDKPLDAKVAFRVAGRQPEWWNPLDGTMRDLPVFTATQTRTTIPLQLGPHQSGFVVLRKKASAMRATGAANFPTYRAVLTLEKPWQVSFDPRWGGPAQITFPTLDDWSLRPEDGIKHYSGKAVYRAAFDVPATAFASAPFGRTTARFYLSLGEVKNLASVRLNGKNLGALWCAPWRVEVPTGVLKPIDNRLEITVANLWVNRLIGDSGLPASQRLTATTFNPWKPDSPLQPSGLLGPVTLQKIVR